MLSLFSLPENHKMNLSQTYKSRSVWNKENKQKEKKKKKGRCKERNKNIKKTPKQNITDLTNKMAKTVPLSLYSMQNIVCY